MKFAQVPLEWALNGFGMQKTKQQAMAHEENRSSNTAKNIKEIA